MMNRKPEQGTPPEVTPVDRDGWVKETRTYKIITPLFGGGEEPQKADSITTVRATEARGHLRFWWRATRGGLPEFEGKLEKMREREEQIWGSSAEKNKPGPSRVIVNVQIAAGGKPISTVDVYSKKAGKKIPVELGSLSSPWGYAAFPLREEKVRHANGRIEVKKPLGSVLPPDVEFILEVKYPSTLATDVKAALWAWETFGGIGARTRRGFGAIQLESEESESRGIEEGITKSLKKHVATGDFPDGVPHLTPDMEVAVKTFGKPSDKDRTAVIEAWEFLIKKLKDFRQKRYEGSGNTPGRSKWPEPDSIRQILNADKKYTFGTHKPQPPVLERFPRAKFGLPIRFEFPVPKPPKPDPKDPKTTTLQGVPMRKNDNKPIDRLASPLIIRPLKCKNGEAAGIALVLKWKAIETDEDYTPPGGLMLSGDAYGEFHVKSDLVSTETSRKPLNEFLKGQTDVLQAFLDTLK